MTSDETTNDAVTPGVGKAPEATFISVNADYARQWLDKNTCNRPVRPKVVAMYARDMVAGKWSNNGETIKFDRTGALADGQHRLKALILADETTPGIEIEFLVVEDIDPAGVLSIDAGLSRTWRDYRAMHGTQAAGSMSAIIRRVANWDGGIRMPTGSNRISLTNGEIDDFFAQHSERLELSVKQASKLYTQHRISPASAGTAFFLFHRLDAETAFQFFDDIANWTQNLPPGHPVLALVQAVNNRRTDGTLNADVVLMLLVMAWNSVLHGDTGRLKYQAPKGGLTNASFPAPDKPRWV